MPALNSKFPEKGRGRLSLRTGGNSYPKSGQPCVTEGEKTQSSAHHGKQASRSVCAWELPVPQEMWRGFRQSSGRTGGECYFVIHRFG